jgi:hypothetical protein
MTPSEKAKQLVQKFYFSLPNNGGQTGLCNVHQRWDEGKICARIAANEIIDAIDWHEYETPNKELNYWLDVRKEIEKL